MIPRFWFWATAAAAWTANPIAIPTTNNAALRINGSFEKAILLVSVSQRNGSRTQKAQVRAQEAQKCRFGIYSCAFCASCVPFPFHWAKPQLGQPGRRHQLSIDGKGSVS